MRPVTSLPDVPLTEFDPARLAMIEPGGPRPDGKVPPRLVLCFFADVTSAVVAERGGRSVARQQWEHGVHEIWELAGYRERVGVLQPGVGAPLAAGLLEEAIGLGGRAVVVCGGAGALVPELVLGHAVVPTAALRDEGTSYHYLPPSRLVAADPAGVAAVQAALAARELPYVSGTTWTTDAPYRETPAKVAARRAEGCLTVEMEAAALFAVAHFRGVPLGQVLYAGDSLAAQEWDHRSWQTAGAVRRELFDVAVDAVLALEPAAG
jgi:uridine phosphorylase